MQLEQLEQNRMKVKKLEALTFSYKRGWGLISGIIYSLANGWAYIGGGGGA